MKRYTFDEFMDIIRKLRAPDGCPWDREQTHESLIPCIKEEAYEVIEAINRNDRDNLREELGDVLLQVAMHSVIGEEENQFTIEDVISEVSEKMIRRHPHVFGSGSAADSGEVLANWEEIKRKEHKEKTVSESIANIPAAFPANIRAEKVMKKAARAGADFNDEKPVWEQILSGVKKLEKVQKAGDRVEIDEEFGNLMFSMIHLSRFLQINAENSLTNATDKFINRFVSIERIAKNVDGGAFPLSQDELGVLWRRMKQSE